MPLPSAADQVIIQGFLLDENTGRGDTTAVISSVPVPLTGQDPKRPLVLDTNDHVHIRTNTRTTTPDPETGYWALLALSTNDPDLTAYGGRKIDLPGDTVKTIEVPYSAQTTVVTEAMAAQVNAGLPSPLLVVGQQVRAIWYHEAAGFTVPSPPDAYPTSTQMLSAIESGIDAHDADSTAHPDIRALAQNATVADATTTVKGRAVILGGTADNPTVPYGKVTGAPTSLPPSGGAGGVLGGTFPNPSFAVDMATQAELDAVNASIPEQARDVLGAALVGGSNVTITPNDGADTITISVTIPPSYSDEQAQDAAAALIASGSHSGIAFAYNDTGNALSATVSFPVSSVAGKTGAVSLVKGDVGLGNVDNTSDATKNAAAVTLSNKVVDGGTY